MKTIKLSQEGKKRDLNLVALVDDADYEWLNQWKWCVYKSRYTFYARRRQYEQNDKVGKEVSMHRVILGLTDSSIKADHADRNGLNNQRENLRVASNAQNGANKCAHRSSTSQYLGVSWKSKNQRWVAQIVKRGYIGIYKTEIEAAIAYNEAAKAIHGEFANLNIIKP